MKPRDKALKLLLESNITGDLNELEMTYRIADVLEKVIAERDELEKMNSELKVKLLCEYGKIDDIMQICRGLRPTEWEDAT